MIESGITHDIVLVDSASKKIGLMLQRDKNGKPQYFIDDDPYLPSQFLTGTPGYGNLPVEKEIAIRQDDWRHGFGREYYSSEYSKAYYSSIGADARFKGMAIAGPVATAITMPFTTGLALTNATMEEGTLGAEALDENYDGTGGDVELSGATWKAQTFTPPTDLTITKVAIKIKREGSPGTVTASIRATSSSLPTGNDLSTAGTINGNDLTEAYAWTDIDMADCALLGGTEYAIVVRATDGDASNHIFWEVNISGAYAGGQGAHSGDSGASWSVDTAYDHGFKTYGKRTTVNNWTGGARTSEQKSAGSYSLWVYDDSSYQEMSWDDTYQGQYFKVSVAVYCSAANTARIGISNKAGDTPTYSSYHSGTPGWETLTVRKILDSDATRLRVLCYSDTAADAFFDTAAFVDPTSGVVAWAEFNDLLYAGVGDILIKLNSSGTAFTAVENFEAEITDLESFTDDNLYIALGASNNYWYMSTVEGFTEVTDGRALLFQRVGTTMWKALLPRSVDSATDPTADANWAGVTTIGSSAENITGLEEMEGTIYIFKEDMPYYIDSTPAVQRLMPELASLKATTSGKNALEYKKNLYVPCGTQSLYEYDDGTVTELSPSNFCTNLSEFVGRVQALAFDERYLYAIVDNSSKIELLAGGWETVDGSTDWRWHPIAELTLAGCETAFVSSVFQKRIYIASTSSSDSLYYYILPTGYGDITGDSNYRYTNGGYFITPWLHANFRADDKAFIKLILTTANTSDDVYITAYYRVLGQAGWTLIGKFTTPPVQTRYLPPYSATNPVSTMIQFKFTFVTNDAKLTPVLLDYDCRAILYPTKRRIINCVVRCADNILGLDGIRDNERAGNDQNAASISTAIKAADNATWPQQIYDISNTSTYVKVIAMREEEVKAEKDRNIERLFYLQLQEVSLS